MPKVLYILHTTLHIRINCFITHNSRRIEPALMAITKQMGKENMAYILNGVQL